MHVLWQCHATNDVWSEAIKAVQKWRVGEGDLLGLLEELVKKLTQAKMEETIAIMRGLWLRRNTFVFENKLLSHNNVIRAAIDSLEEYQTTNVQMTENRSRAEGLDQKWKPPNVNCLKANWDAALDVKLRRVGLGVIIRNNKGEVMATGCDSKSYVEQPAIAEGWALSKAMELCKDLSFNRVILEGDA
ncbi:hypothetical protein F2P56_030240 [Juglans regia]|nr:hypothetical protein F2P56_030240 [Juglans regia]